MTPLLRSAAGGPTVGWNTLPFGGSQTPQAFGGGLQDSTAGDRSSGSPEVSNRPGPRAAEWQATPHQLASYLAPPELSQWSSR